VQTETSANELAINERLLGRLLEDRAAQYGDREFLHFKGSRSISYRELNEAANRFGNGLMGLGLGKDKKLAIMLPKAGGTSIKLPSIARTRGRVCMKSIDLLSGILGSVHACGFMRAR